MTIAIAINGEGMGHAARCTCLARRLQRDHRVVIWAPRSVLGFLRQNLPDVSFHHLPLLALTKKRHRICMLPTVTRNAGLVLALGGAMGCGEMSSSERIGSSDQNQGWGADGEEGDGDWSGGDDREPAEQVVPYEFSAPAIVGDFVYVANESLNSVAIVDSQTLGVRTVMTGSRPTEVVGPGVEGAASEEARVMALNQGNHTVTLIHPEDFTATNQPVLARSNRIAMAPGGRHALVWYDSARAQSGEPAGDLSAVSVVSAAGSFQVAVGFHVRDVRFDSTGEQALVITDDGVSVLKLATISSDSFSPPRKIVPDELADHPVRSLNLEVTSDGRYVVAHRQGFPFLVVSDLETQEVFALELPAAPTGVALRESEGEAELLAVIRSEGLLVRASIPEGLRAAYEGGLLPEPEPEPEEEEEPEPEEEEEQEAEETWPWPEYEGFEIFPLPFVGPGSIALSADSSKAFLFTTLNSESRAVLLSLEDQTDVRVLNFEKGIRGALADGRGDAFLIFHDRQEGTTAGLSPIDPLYVARSWGFSLLDVRTATTRLFLTELEPGDAALWSPESGDARVFMTFKEPSSAATAEPAHYDVVTVNLSTFRKDTFRLASLPDGLGLIPAAEKVYVNQVHPQGRMTFVDVHTNDRQTVTGYQLNAGVQ